jgi:hypothetical protein
MTTITSSIIPTERLAQWRSSHPERYPFVLSDSLPPWKRSSVERSCIRTRKTWLIENTLYASSRDGGTFPLRTPSPKEFHEMQWLLQHDNVAKVVDEPRVSVSVSDRPSDKTTEETLPKRSAASFDKSFQESSPRSSLLNKFVTRISRERKEPEQEQRRQSWLLGALSFESGPLKHGDADADKSATVPLPDGCQVPNAIFARKHLLSHTGPLPPQLPIRQMPIAESKATDTLIEAASSGLLHEEKVWHFRGPFTPQLGYDGGLDYRWVYTGLHPSERTSKSARPDSNEMELPDNHETQRFASSPPINMESRTKRKAFYFGLESAKDWLTSYHKPTPPLHSSNSLMEAKRLGGVQRESPNTTCPCSVPKDDAKDAPTSPRCDQQRSRRKWRSPLQLDSIEFMTPVGRDEKLSSIIHRKTTVVQAPPPTPPALQCLQSVVNNLERTPRMCCLLHRQLQSPSSSTKVLATGNRDTDSAVQFCDCLKELEEEFSLLSPRAIECKMGQLCLPLRIDANVI